MFCQRTQCWIISSNCSFLWCNDVSARCYISLIYVNFLYLKLHIVNRLIMIRECLLIYLVNSLWDFSLLIFPRKLLFVRINQSSSWKLRAMHNFYRLIELEDCYYTISRQLFSSETISTTNTTVYYNVGRSVLT